MTVKKKKKNSIKNKFPRKIEENKQKKGYEKNLKTMNFV